MRSSSFPKTENYMLRDNNSIIVVDDNEDDLKAIANVFNMHGIGCKTIECDGFNLLQNPLQGVKLAFFDINFTDAGDETAILSALRKVLVSVVSKDNGPFVLVFWTTNPQLVANFKTFINRDNSYRELPKPIFIATLDKSSFIAQPEQLTDAIDRIYSSDLVKCLFAFNEELQEASNDCMSNITSLINVDELWGECTLFEKRFKEIFSKISIETLGMNNGRQNPDMSIKESLVPLFVYNLCNNNSTVWRNYLKLEQVDEDTLKGIDIKDIAPSLNTYYHIDLNTSDPFERGVVRFVNAESDEFKNRIGFEKETWVRTRFLNGKYTPQKEYDIVALEFSAACDYANNKHRLHKFMMGILCKEEDATHIKKKRIAENVYDLGFTFIYNSERYGLILDLNSTFNEEDTEIFKLLGDSLFKLKHEIMNVITVRHANHESRLGFSCFK